MITEKLLGANEPPLEKYCPFGVADDELKAYVNVPGSFTTLVTDDEVPILFLRGKKSLRLDMSINLGVDHERAAKILIDAVERIANRARANGFSELVIECVHPELTKVAVDMGFSVSGNDLVKALL